MAEITDLKATYDVSPVLAGFLGAGVLVVSVTAAVFLWACCQRRYRLKTGAYKLTTPYDPPMDPPYKFIHMLKGISIYPESLSGSKKLVRVKEWSRGDVLLVDPDPEGGTAHLQMNHLVPPVDRALPIRADYCCQERPSHHACPSPALGTLSLAIDYNFSKKALVVTIIGAQGLPAVDEQGVSSDPYVKMTILPEKKHRVKTRVLRRSLEPVFDETFTFYGVPYASLPQLRLHFLVLSFDRFARDDVIGEAVVPLEGIDPGAGRALVTEKISKRKTACDSRGELLLSLSYQPVTHRLNVVVLKAKHLPAMDIAGLTGNPYVKVNVFYGRKRIAKKKTHMRKGTLNPVFNESFVYDVPAELMPDISVELLVVDFDRTAKHEVVGRVVLGGQSPISSGVTHWREVCDNPRRQIAKWHDLMEH